MLRRSERKRCTMGADESRLFGRTFRGWAVLCAMAAVMACEERNVYAPPPPPSVTVVQPTRSLVADHLEYTGNTEAVNTVQLRARVQGVLEKVLFKDGDLVKEGQLLFVIQQNTYQAQLEQARAQILQQKANYDHAMIETDRYTRLVQQNAAPQTDLDNWKFQRDASKAGVMAAQAARDLAELNLGYTKITAPFSGRIGRHLVDPGNLVGAGEFTPLASINQIDPLYVYFNVNEPDVLRMMGETGSSAIRPEDPRIPLMVGLADETGYPHEGYVDFRDTGLTPTTGTLLFRGILPNSDGKILPGLFARVRIRLAGSEKPALLVPEEAVGYDQLGAYVLVVDEKNVVEHRTVKPDARVGERRAIREGLAGGDWVVIRGQIQAFPGKQVTPNRITDGTGAGSTASSNAQPGKGTP